jgi:DNA-binding NarL/FixJ family response regulator
MSRGTFGQRHPRAKLTDHEVRLVLALVECGLRYRVIADKFEVSKSCVAGIAQGRRRVYFSERVV